MNRLLHWCACFAFAVGLIASSVAPSNAQEKKDAPVVPPRDGKREKVQIFNGKNLDGWIGHEQYWTVHDGVITGKNTDKVPVDDLTPALLNGVRRKPGLPGLGQEGLLGGGELFSGALYSNHVER